MQVQKITHQPNFNGKVVFDRVNTEGFATYGYDSLWHKLKEISNIVADKPYDIFVLRNQQNPEFFDIAANKSIEEAKKVKEYTVKVQNKALSDSIVDAAKDAMAMYEKYILKNIKG